MLSAVRPMSEGNKRQPPPSRIPRTEPGWTRSLRKLYDSVVDEPLPDSFDDLLRKLDERDDAG